MGDPLRFSGGITEQEAKMGNTESPKRQSVKDLTGELSTILAKARDPFSHGVIGPGSDTAIETILDCLAGLITLQRVRNSLVSPATAANITDIEAWLAGVEAATGAKAS